MVIAGLFLQSSWSIIGDALRELRLLTSDKERLTS
jgi:hypothetical protein